MGLFLGKENLMLKPILLRGPEDYHHTKERWEILKEYFTENNIDFWEISAVEGNVLTKIINLIYLLDFATIYKAVINKIDPNPVKSIDFIKKKIMIVRIVLFHVLFFNTIIQTHSDKK